MHGFVGFLNFSTGTMSSIGGLLTVQNGYIDNTIAYQGFLQFFRFAPLQTKWLDVLITSEVGNLSTDVLSIDMHNEKTSTSYVVLRG
jgi:hypothetical protein